MEFLVTTTQKHRQLHDLTRGSLIFALAQSNTVTVVTNFKYSGGHSCSSDVMSNIFLFHSRDSFLLMFNVHQISLCLCLAFFCDSFYKSRSLLPKFERPIFQITICYEQELIRLLHFENSLVSHATVYIKLLHWSIRTTFFWLRCLNRGTMKKKNIL